MPDLCTPTFAKLAGSLGFSCQQAGGLIEVRSPLHLANWTLPVLELTVIIGAVLTLVYAINRWRHHGDATNIALWFGAVSYLLIIEPPLYFPGAFGIAGHVDTMFAHNVFTVDFLWGRLPLYIVGIYPLMATIAFEIVRSLGIFRRYSILVGACAVGFVHNAFYEVFDQLGPQLRWWEWSVHNPLNQPMFDSVPLPSVVVFATLWPMSLALCVQFFVGQHADRGRRFTGAQVIWRTVVAGILASLGTAILPLPATVMGAVTDGSTSGGVTYTLELLIVCAVAVPALVNQWRRLRTTTPNALEPRYITSPLLLNYSAAYLTVIGVLWLSALPAYFGAVGGVTADGDPTGSLWYTLLCFTIAGTCIVAVRSAAPTTSATSEPVPAAG
ncbi:MAG: hypothetical protein WCE30_01790 [Mycobacterium sp.]